jgi:hypothetical protein
MSTHADTCLLGSLQMHKERPFAHDRPFPGIILPVQMYFASAQLAQRSDWRKLVSDDPSHPKTHEFRLQTPAFLIVKLNKIIIHTPKKQKNLPADYWRTLNVLSGFSILNILYIYIYIKFHSVHHRLVQYPDTILFSWSHLCSNLRQQNYTPFYLNTGQHPFYPEVTTGSGHVYDIILKVG